MNQIPFVEDGYYYGTHRDNSDDTVGELLTAIRSQKNIAIVKKAIDVVSKKMKTNEHVRSDEFDACYGVFKRDKKLGGRLEIFK